MGYRSPKATKDQQVALLILYRRNNDEYLKPDGSYLKFRRKAFWSFGNCLMIQWCCMTIGIEPDGYTHS